MLGVGSYFVGPNLPPAKSQLRLGVELDRILRGAGCFHFLPYPEKPLYLQLNSHSSFFRQEACSSIQKLHMAQGPWDGEPLSGLPSGQGGPTKGDLLN